MADLGNWALPEEVRAKAEELDFDLNAALDSMVMLQAQVPEDAFTAEILGTERGGNGIVLNREGLVLTIGYLITEAETIWLTTHSGQAVAGYPLVYDFATGFGLVQALGRLNATPLARGSIESVKAGDEVIVISHGGARRALKAKLTGKREFAGYWEYLLDEALFTTPAHPEWSGAALLGPDGRLIGIGSLLVQEALEGETSQGNMSVPIDLLAPILAQLESGGGQRPSRPWLGMYSLELDGQLVVKDVADGAPAQRAGIQPGDVVLAVNEERVSGLADFLRKLWRAGANGAQLTLTLKREARTLQTSLRGADRNDFLKKPRLH
jgi:S1-C subfamily serine protease